MHVSPPLVRLPTSSPALVAPITCRLYMVQEPGSPDLVQVKLDDPSDADKFVPGAVLRVSGKRKVPPGQQKLKRIKADSVQVLAGGRGRGGPQNTDGDGDGETTDSGSGGEPMLLTSKPLATAATVTVGTVQQLPVKLAQMKLLVVPSKPQSEAAVSCLSRAAANPNACLPTGLRVPP